MRALDNYNKEKDRKLGMLVGTCMQTMWLSTVVINSVWLLIVYIEGEYTSGLLARCLWPTLVTGLFLLIYHFVVMKKERVVARTPAYIILNGYVMLLLVHPADVIMMDAMVFGVMVLYPVWGDRMWVKLQTLLLAAFVALRHLLTAELIISAPNSRWIGNLVGVYVIGVMIYYNTEHVHKLTMVLGDATRMDAATGLYNHESFYEELEMRMVAFGQTPGKDLDDAIFCLMIADIDNFKKVNDTYGHAFGDEVLIGLSDIFKRYCGGKDFAARYGGEEFVLIVGNCQKRDALTRANTIRRKFEDTVFTDATGEEHRFTISIGVAQYDRPWETASMFFDQADQALYQAKNTGKNRVCSA